MYLAHERRAYILRLLEARGSLRSAALARELRVTDETIRTDLVQLQAEGLLRRVHGGAVYTPPGNRLHPQDEERLEVQLARLLAAHIPAKARLLIIDTPLAPALAACLSSPPCTFITPNPALLLHLSARSLPHRVECTGGVLDKASGLLRPAAPEADLRRLEPDLVLLSPPAAGAQSVSYPHRLQADWVQAAVEHRLPCFIAVPAASLAQNNPQPHTRHSVALTPALLVTEDNLPDGLTEALPRGSILTVPYISRATLTENNGWEL